jgi:hypothetical protein
MARPRSTSAQQADGADGEVAIAKHRRGSSRHLASPGGEARNRAGFQSIPSRASGVRRRARRHPSPSRCISRGLELLDPPPHRPPLNERVIYIALLGGDAAQVWQALRIAHDTVRVATQGILLGIGLSVLAMLAAAAGFLPPIAGAFLQEGIDVSHVSAPL